MIPIIAHLDMNSYFASVEQQDHPEWRGLPVGVCEHLGGIIIAASVEAKKWGISTGTPVWEARKLYPKIILTQTNAERYRFYTRRFLKVVGEYTGDVEKYSIDECFFDLTKVCNVQIPNSKYQRADDKEYKTGVPAILNPTSSILYSIDPYEEAVRVALEIKKRMKVEVGDWLRCSIGIADSKTLAKIGSDMKKPDGIVVIGDSKFKIENLKNKFGHECLILFKDELYERLKLIDIPGIGRRQEKNLNQLGIRTLTDLRDYPKSWLVSRFGRIAGYHLYSLGQLKTSWKAGVRNEEEIKSMGHMYTLPAQFRKPEFFMPVLYKLCEMVGRRLRKKKLTGNIIHCYVRDKNYEGFGQSVKLGYLVQDGRDIFLECSRIFESLDLLSLDFRLIGVTVAGLQAYSAQLSLFGDVERKREVVKALDVINEKYGEFSIIRAGMFKAGKVFRDSVGFGRVKEL